MILSLVKIVFAILYSGLMATLEILAIPFHRTGKLFHALSRVHALGILIGCGVKVKVEGLEKVDFTRSAIYVANHASYFDIPAVVAGIPAEIRIVYKKELERIPIFGWGLKYGKTYIGIDRGGGQDAVQSLEEAATKIRNGASVIMFAEGTRSRDGNLQPFKRGPFFLAVKAGVPVVPVTITGSYGVLPRNSLRIRPGTITVTLSEPVEAPQSNGKDSEFVLRDKVHEVIEKNLRQSRM